MNDVQNSVSEQMIALLTRCLQLQSEKDGVSAPVGLSDTFDDFARQLEQHGQLRVENGDSYADAALAWLERTTGTVNNQ